MTKAGKIVIVVASLAAIGVALRAKQMGYEKYFERGEALREDVEGRIQDLGETKELIKEATSELEQKIATMEETWRSAKPVIDPKLTEAVDKLIIGSDRYATILSEKLTAPNVEFFEMDRIQLDEIQLILQTLPNLVVRQREENNYIIDRIEQTFATVSV